jgi:hypothetical protein
MLQNNLLPPSSGYTTLKLIAAGFFKALAFFYKTSLRHIPEDSTS